VLGLIGFITFITAQFSHVYGDHYMLVALTVALTLVGTSSGDARVDAAAHSATLGLIRDPCQRRSWTLVDDRFGHLLQHRGQQLRGTLL
jgi:hypothetical protein